LTPELDPDIAAYIDRVVDERVTARIDEVLGGKRFRKQLNLRERITRSRLHESLYVGPRDRVTVDPTAVVKSVMFNTSSGRIVVEKDVLIAHYVCLLTGVHDVERLGDERKTGVPIDGRDIVVREGAWLATAAIIVGPCEIGEHAVVGAGAVVTRDVEPYTLVAGNPAKPVGTVGPEGERPERANGRRRAPR
jgi:acetyltransferase-like isoleucine patch superfamily enzyme